MRTLEEEQEWWTDFFIGVVLAQAMVGSFDVITTTLNQQ